MLKKRARIDEKDINGQTPLHIACQHKQEAIVQILVDAYADVNMGDISYDAPIHLACKVTYRVIYASLEAGQHAFKILRNPL